MDISGDTGQQNGQWDPGDGWVDNGDGVVNLGTFGNPQDTYEIPNEIDYEDVWPPPNGVWDEGEVVEFDYGQDGIANTEDPGEVDGIFIAWDSGENDGVVDIGD